MGRVARTCIWTFVAATILAGPTAAATHRTHGATASDSYTIDVQFGGPGTVVPPGPVTVARGGSQHFDFVPTGCAAVLDASVDITTLGPVTGYTFDDVEDDHSLYVAFGPPPTTTHLAACPASGSCLVPDTLVATVAGGDAGTVQFCDGVNLLGTAPVANGQAMLVLAPLGVGSYELSAAYSGTACSSPSEAEPIPYVVQQAPPGTVTAVLTSSDLPLGNPLYAYVTVQGADVSHVGGRASLYEGSTLLQSQDLTGGHTEFVVWGLGLGDHQLVAQVPAGACIGALTTNGVTVRVIQPPPEGAHAGNLTFSVLPELTMVGQPVELVATEMGGPTEPLATGVIRFSSQLDDTTYAEGQLLNGVAAASYTPPMPPGNRHFVARYDGDSYFMPAVSGLVTLTCSGTSPTTLTLTADHDPSVPADSVVLTARVSPSVSGTITFGDGSGHRVDAPLIDGVATHALAPAAPGAYREFAVFAGDTIEAWSSDTAIVAVASPQRIPLLVSDHDVAARGAMVTFRALLDSTTSTGTIAFHVDGAVAATVPVSHGQAVFATDTLRAGVRSVFATWSGDPVDVSNVIVPRIGSALPAGLRVASPNGGETLVVGTVVDVRWDCGAADAAPQVRLLLQRRPDVPWETIADAAPNDGVFAWTVTDPATGDGSGGARTARIAVVDPTAAVAGDTCDATFWISPPGATASPRPALPAAFALEAPRPNPARSTVDCRFDLPRDAPVRLSICDVAGREVAPLAEGRYAAGRHEAIWNASSRARRVQPGVYFVRLAVADQVFVARLAVVR